jgi:very-short-patch-repair endonuclease
MYDALRIVASYEYGFDLLGEDRGFGEPITIETQVQIGSCRVDIVVSTSFGDETIRIVVECDGHDWHERTPEQASRDKRRDRFLQRRGYLVFRFTGRDIVHDPRGCASDVLGAIMDWLSEQADKAYHGR